MKSLFLLAGATAMIAVIAACPKQADKIEPAAANAATTTQPAAAAQPATTPPTVVAQADAAKPAAAPAAGDKSAGDKPYGTVVDGAKVNAFTMEGFRTWRAAACDRCHGANQEGLVGPSLINSLKTLSKEDFKTTVTNGRLPKGMPSFSESKQVMDHQDNLYAYLKGRSDGAITKAHVQAQE